MEVFFVDLGVDVLIVNALHDVLGAERAGCAGWDLWFLDASACALEARERFCSVVLPAGIFFAVSEGLNQVTLRILSQPLRRGMKLSFALGHACRHQALHLCLQGMLGLELHLMPTRILTQTDTHLWNFHNVVRWQSVSQRLLREVVHRLLLLFGAQANLLKRCFRNLTVLLETIEAVKITL